MADGFPKETFSFLRGLSKNDKKPWFEAHKDDYENFWVAPALAFVEALGPRQSSGFVSWCAKEFEMLDPINVWLRR